VLGLSENLAGVTVLAFGNGSPDIFTSLVGAPRGRSELVFGELIGKFKSIVSRYNKKEIETTNINIIAIY
jgi:sodium/potassium/calcium exchanger 6